MASGQAVTVVRPAGIHYKTRDEIAIMREANLIVAQVLDELVKHCQPGVTTLELDRIAEDKTLELGARPAFKGYRVRDLVYRHALCASPNDVVVHGVPRADRKLQEGDIVGLDYGVVYRGFYGDAARTVAVGEVPDEVRRLLEVTEEALYKGIEECVPDGRLQNIGHAIQTHAEAHGYAVVRSFVGHGIGRALHEDPPVPNVGQRDRGLKLKPGLVLAIEPMVNMGTDRVEMLEDGWTAVTADGSFSAHFEHSVAITEEGPFILSQP